VARNRPIDHVRVNTYFYWDEPTGDIIGRDEVTYKPIYQVINHEAEGWLEQYRAFHRGYFDNTPVSDREPVELYGRIFTGFSESIFQTQLLRVALVPHQGLNVDTERAFWTFLGRVTWRQTVAIPDGTRRRQYKHHHGEAISINGNAVRGWREGLV